MNNKFYIDPGHWRKESFTRPWYIKALKIMPNAINHSIIELGSGGGEFAKKLKLLVKKIICVDGSKIYVNKLRQQGFNAIKVDLNQKLPFKTHQFDGAVSLEVIEHLYNAENFLKEIKRILKPKGWLIISTPNIAWWGYRLSSLFGNPPKKEGYHLRHFTNNTFIKKLNKANFKVRKSTSFATIPFINKLLIKLGLKPIYPEIKFLPNLLTQDLVFLCQKK